MLKCVIFDLDGTLVTSELDFGAIKREIGMGPEPVLEYIARAEPAEKVRASEILERHERRAAETCQLMEGAEAVLKVLEERGEKVAIFTRNSRSSVETVLRRLGLRVDAVVAREDAPPKPSPEPVLLIGKRLGISPQDMLVVGDYVYDIQSGLSAGAKTVLLRYPERAPFALRSDYEIGALPELIPIVEALLDGRE